MQKKLIQKFPDKDIQQQQIETSFIRIATSLLNVMFTTHWKNHMATRA